MEGMTASPASHPRAASSIGRTAHLLRRPTTCLLLGEEAEEEDREDREEDDRLLDRHRHASDLLVDVRRESPEPAAVDVRVVDRLGQESQQQTDWACEDESEEEG